MLPSSGQTSVNIKEKMCEIPVGQCILITVLWEGKNLDESQDISEMYKQLVNSTVDEHSGAVCLEAAEGRTVLVAF